MALKGKDKQHVTVQDSVPADQVGSGGTDAPAKESPGDAVTDESARLREEVEQLKDKYLRARAEQQNALRRANNEVQDAVRFANTQLLKTLLDVVDDFDRTMEASEQGQAASAVLEGVRLIQGKLHKVLSDEGVEVIDAEGRPFDPALHEALMKQASSNHEPGIVIQQVQKGYQLKDRVLRPAKVIVSAPAPAPEASDASEASEM